ncbi:MAG: glycosyltransferase family 2 protein [Chloroflexi bacterium]|nr:glycosyltransferase family 2 protein [Chloroflexota bacterium]
MSDPPLGSGDPERDPRIVVLIPCLNEEPTIAQVVRDFHVQLPTAQVVVFDNDSTDGSARQAADAGAHVFLERRRGKGFVVQSMFQRVDADVYVLVDGDDTYPAERASNLIGPILADEADMVVGTRIADATNSALHPFNRFGNVMYQRLVNRIFGTHLTDILSGYRAMNRRLVKGLPLFLTGFEVEAELTIKALERGYRIAETPVVLRPRRSGSRSKIRIVRDGSKILWTILALARDYKPLTFVGLPGVVLVVGGLALGLIPISEYLTTGLVLRLPTAILAVGLVVFGMLLVSVGLILHTVNRRFQELEFYTRSLLDRGD